VWIPLGGDSVVLCCAAIDYTHLPGIPPMYLPFTFFQQVKINYYFFRKSENNFGSSEHGTKISCVSACQHRFLCSTHSMLDLAVHYSS
jgi:hypothetical protein